MFVCFGSVGCLHWRKMKTSILLCCFPCRSLFVSERSLLALHFRTELKEKWNGKRSFQLLCTNTTYTRNEIIPAAALATTHHIQRERTKHVFYLFLFCTVFHSFRVHHFSFFSLSHSPFRALPEHFTLFGPGVLLRFFASCSSEYLPFATHLVGGMSGSRSSALWLYKDKWISKNGARVCVYIREKSKTLCGMRCIKQDESESKKKTKQITEHRETKSVEEIKLHRKMFQYELEVPELRA